MVECFELELAPIDHIFGNVFATWYGLLKRGDKIMDEIMKDPTIPEIWKKYEWNEILEGQEKIVDFMEKSMGITISDSEFFKKNPQEFMKEIKYWENKIEIWENEIKREPYKIPVDKKKQMDLAKEEEVVARTEEATKRLPRISPSKRQYNRFITS